MSLASLFAIALGVKSFQLNSDDEIQVPLDFLHTFTYNGAPIHEGDIVEVMTAAYGKQHGRVLSICASPFWGESWMTAYIGSLEREDVWTTYERVEDES